ncbi:hypothetical protein BaRGS_00037514, partial [Batillaria attramentaria]
MRMLENLAAEVDQYLVLNPTVDWPALQLMTAVALYRATVTVYIILLLAITDGRVRHVKPSRVAAAALALAVGTETADKASGFDMFEYSDIMLDDLAEQAKSIPGDLDLSLL